MNSDPPLETSERLFAALGELIAKIVEAAPAAAALLPQILRPGDSGAESNEAPPGPFSIDFVFEALHRFEAAGPEAWFDMIDRLDEWVKAAMNAESRAADPIFAAIEAALTELGRTAAGLLSGADGDAKLDELVMPWVERLSAACVDAALGTIR